MEINNNQLITTEDYPESFVRDFQVFLKYIDQHKMKLTKARNYLMRKDLKAIYPLLSKHQPSAPEKGNQDQYPLIHLFFHLADTLRLTKKIATKSSVSLEVDSDRFHAYNELNRSEQYATLLEAFWTGVDWDEIKREWSGKAPDNIDFLFEELQELPVEKTVEVDRQLKWVLYDYEHFLYYFEYLGFWEIEVEIKYYDNSDKTGYTQPKAIKLRSLLRKLIPVLLETWEPSESGYDSLLGSIMSLFGEDVPYQEEDTEEPVESLFSLMQPLFPAGELEKTLPDPKEAEIISGNYIFTVALGPDCWRRLKLPSSATLFDLHNLIQSAFEFDDDHLYSFFMDGKQLSKHAYHSPMDIRGPFVQEMEIGRLQLYEGQRFLYLFDFGDEWEFDITFEKVEEEDPETAIVEKKGEAPLQYGW